MKFKQHCQPTSVQLDAIERYKFYKRLWEQAAADIEANGTIFTASNGAKYRNPSLDVLHKSQTHLTRLMTQFGQLLERE